LRISTSLVKYDVKKTADLTTEFCLESWNID
jgi:hypothetical protein